MGDREPYDYLLLTALTEENAALHEALRAAGAEGPSRARWINAPTGQKWGLPHEFGTLRVLTVSIHDMGEEKAREWTRLLLTSVAPKYVGFIGIAGAAEPEAEFGEILIAERIWYYELAKVRADDTDYRGPEHRSEGILLDRLRYNDLDRLQRMFPGEGPWRPPRIGVIASGEKVVANPALREQLRRGKKNVIGFEMEGHGFASEVVRTLGSEKWFMVRSVSDRADHTKSDDYRVLACRRAAQYAVGFMIDTEECIAHDARAHTSSAPDHAAAPPIRPDLVALLNGLALAFAERSPDDFVALLGTAGEDLPVELRVAEATAHWRRDDAAACRRACQMVLDATAKDKAFSREAALATRLSAWSLYRIGEAAQGKQLLTAHLARVEDVSERGRWADLIAQCCRFSSNDEDRALTLTFYEQARQLKEEGGDHFGQVITLQQMARVCLERLDLAECEAFYRKAVEIASARDFPQRVTCDVTSLLGLAWLDMIRRGDLNILLARRRLSSAGALLRDVPSGALERDLRAAAGALSTLLDVLTGAKTSVTSWEDVSAVWASVVYGQARVHCGEPLHRVTAAVAKQATGRPSVSVGAIPSLLAAFQPATPPPREREWTACTSDFWPLSDWVRFAAPGDGIRLIEGLVSLYTLILSRLSMPGPQSVGAPAGLDKLVAALSHFGHSNPKSALAREVAAVATVVRQAIPLRNRWAHALPGDAAEDLATRLDSFANAALKEARMLRCAKWVDGTSILVGDTRIDLGDSVVWYADEGVREVRFPGREALRSERGGGGES